MLVMVDAPERTALDTLAAVFDNFATPPLTERGSAEPSRMTSLAETHGESFPSGFTRNILGMVM